MHGFRRSIQIATGHRLILFAVLASSLAVAVCWGANLGTIYPIVDVVLKGRSLHAWVTEEIQSTEADCKNWRQMIAGMGTELERVDDPDRRRLLKQERSGLSTRLEADQQALARFRRVQPWIRRYTPNEPFPTLILVVALLILGTIIKTGFMVVNALLVERLALNVSFQVRKQLFRKTLDMDLAGIHEGHTSELLTYFTHDAECLATGIRTIFGRALREPLKITTCLIGATFICWRLLAFSLIATPLSALPHHAARAVHKTSKSCALEEMTNLYERLSESLAGIELVKVFAMERHERRQFHLVSKEYMNKSMRIAFYQALAKPINEVVGIAVIASAILVGGYLVLNEETHLFGVLRMSNRPLNFGSLMTFFALLAGISDPFRKLADVYGDIQRAAAAADRLFVRIDRLPKIVDPVQGAPITKLNSLSFESVRFSYRGSVEALKGVDLEIRAGQTLAIVGPNGCGKSTLTKLIPRFYDCSAGCIRWNGVDLREYRRRDLRARIGLVAQRTLLFNDTVFNNIRYGAPHASRAEVMEAAKRAHAHEFIETELPGGYEAVVGQEGNCLSGGQRQRLAMARSLLCEPELLILDEATSQVDLESERLIRESLRAFAGDRTAIVITHRLETLTMCDQIVVMHEGVIVAQGTHDELLSGCDFYRRLHQVQFKIPA